MAELRARIAHYAGSEPNARLMAEALEDHFPKNAHTVSSHWGEQILAEVLTQLGYSPYPAVPKPTPVKK